MKLTLTAIAGGSLATVASATNPSKTIKLGGNRKFRRGDASTEALLRKARPFKRNTDLKAKSSSSSATNTTPRKLNNNFEVDASYNIKFSECVDVKLFDNDLFHEDYVEYTQNGQIVAAKSFVLFHVCQEDDCFYESDEDLYIVDLATYVQNVALYHAYARNEYCDVCANYEDTCNAGDDAAVAYGYGDDAAAANDDDGQAENDGEADEEEPEEEGGEGEEAAAEEGEEGGGEEAANEGNDGGGGGGGGRKLKQKKNQRRTKMAVDCDQCAEYNCFEKYDDDSQQTQEEIDADVADWIVSLSQCQKTGEQWKGEDLYVGLMCSAYGDGAELAVFVDEECSVYTTTKSFNDVYNPYFYSYMSDVKSQDFVSLGQTYIQNSFTETMPCRAMKYVAPGYGSDDDNIYQYGVNDYCQNVFDSGAVDFNYCYAGQYQNNNQDDQYSWYEYDMDYNDSDDLDEVCSAVKTMEGEYYHTYDEESSGTWYERDRSGKIKKKRKSYNVGHVFSVFFWVLISLSVVGGIIYFIQYRKRRAKRNQPLYQGGAMI